MSTLTPFFDQRTGKVEFIKVSRPVVTVENSTYSSAKICGTINSAVGMVVKEHKYKLTDPQIDLLNHYCCICFNLGYITRNINVVTNLHNRIKDIWK